MKPMKNTRVIAGILAGAMLFALFGCSGENTNKIISSSSGKDIIESNTDSKSGQSSASVSSQVPAKSPQKKGVTYYISSSTGNDAKDGKSEGNAWKSAEKLKGISLKEGDQVLFKTGDTFNFTYTVNGAGSNENPIVISSYGSDKRPVFSGNNQFGIKLSNTGGIVIENLDFSEIPCGVGIINNKETAGGIRISNCSFRDNNLKATAKAEGSAVKLADTYLTGGTGISVIGEKNAVVSNILIENCYFYGSDLGIAAMGLNDTKTYSKPTAVKTAVSNLTVNNCDFVQLTGPAGILLAQAEKAAISGCKFTGTGYYGNTAIDSSALRIAASKDITVSDTDINSTYSYSNTATGNGILLEGANSNITFNKCSIKDNVGTAFYAKSAGVFAQGKSDKVIFKNCIIENNNVSLSSSNKSFLSDSGNNITISGGQIGLQNDAQIYKDIVKIEGNVSIYNASGKSLQGSLPKNAVISTVKVGVGKAKITPEEKTFIWGYTNPGTALEKYSWCNPATDILDDTFVKVMVFEDTKTKDRILLVSADMCLLYEPDHIPAGTVERWAKKAGVSKDKVYLTTTHDHQGPGALTEKYIARIDSEIEKAVKSMQLVKMGITTVEETASVSRRPKLAINYQMPYDNRMMVINFTSVATGKPVTYSVNLPMHNTALGNGTPSNFKYNTAELTGLAMAYIESKAGNGLTSVFINGAYGDAGPDINGDYQTDYAAIKKRANELGATAYKILLNTPTKAINGVKGASSTTKVSYRPAEKIILSAARIGDLAFFGVNGEIFTGIGAAIKAKSPFPYTITTANTNGFISYMPTYAAIHDGKGGYGVTEANVFRDDIEKVVTDGAISLLNSLSSKAESKLSVKSVSGGKANQSMVPKAFDGDKTTAWEGKDKNALWFQCDLGASKTISKVIVDFGNHSRYDAAEDYVILVSDKKDFSTSELYAAVSGNTVCQLYHRNDNIKGRYVRFVCTKTAKNNTSVPKVYEFEVYTK